MRISDWSSDVCSSDLIHATDVQRIQRALEVFRLSGRPISLWQLEPPAAPRLPCRVLKLVVAPAERAVLHARIGARFAAMPLAGHLHEVRPLRARPHLPSHTRTRARPALPPDASHPP